MIERFNFYDIYGYLIPGFVLLGVLALPVGLTSGFPADLKLPELSAALITLIVAYVAGHLLQIVAAKAIPSTEGRAPSDLILDTSDKTLRIEVKTKLRIKILQQFGIDVGSDEPRTSERKGAFFLCRGALMIAGSKTYSEQFEGMYVMMRGICAASALGFAYDLGWISLRFLRAQPGILSRLQPATVVAIVCVVALAMVSIRGLLSERSKPAESSEKNGGAKEQARYEAKEEAKKKKEEAKKSVKKVPILKRMRDGVHRLLPRETTERALLTGPLLIAFACAGYLTAAGIQLPAGTAHPTLPLVAVTALSALSVLWTLGSYRIFSRLWVKSVYENFLLLKEPAATP